MSLAMALLQRDLMFWPRRPWFYTKRLVFVCVCALIVLFGFGIAMLTRSTTMGLSLFGSLSATVLFCGCVFSGVTTGLNLMREKTERTLGLLFLTDITVLHQVFGKLMTGAFVILMTLLSTFPMFVLCATLGGVSPAQIAGAFALLAGSVFLGCCVGLYAAAASKNERSMLGRVIVGVIIIFAVIPYAFFMLASARGVDTMRVLPIISPFIALREVSTGLSVVNAFWNLLFNVVMGVPFLLLAIQTLPREFDPVRSRMAAWCQSRLLLSRLTFPRKAVSFSEHNPVRAKDLCCIYRGQNREWAVMLMTMIPLWLLVFLVAAGVNAGSLVAAAIIAGGVVGGVCALVFGVLAVVRSARSFNAEKNDRTLELMILSDLTDRQIILGKLGAVLSTVMPWFTVGTVAAALSAAVSDESGVVLFVLGYAVQHVSSIAAFSLLAMFLSLRMRTPTVLAVTIVAYFVWSTFFKYFVTMFLAAIPMIFMSILGKFWNVMPSNMFGLGFGTLMLIANVAIDVVLGIMMLALMRHNFRHLAAGKL